MRQKLLNIRNLFCDGLSPATNARAVRPSRIETAGSRDFAHSEFRTSSNAFCASVQTSPSNRRLHQNATRWRRRQNQASGQMKSSTPPTTRAVLTQPWFTKTATRTALAANSWTKGSFTTLSIQRDQVLRSSGRPAKPMIAIGGPNNSQRMIRNGLTNAERSMPEPF
jgi:hypothetical protein